MVENQEFIGTPFNPLYEQINRLDRTITSLDQEWEWSTFIREEDQET